MFFVQKKKRTEEDEVLQSGAKERPQCPGSSLVQLPIDAVYPNPDQPRRIFDEAALNELAHSIAQYGLIQPVVVRWREDRYELIAGERRWRACKRAGFTQIDAVISDADEVQGACMALVENLQRENLHFFEEAESYLSVMKEFGMTQEELAARLGRNQSTVANKLRVLRLPKAVKDAVIQGRLTERHARALLRLPDEETQLQAARKIREKLLSVKDTERMIEGILEERMEQERQRKKPRVVRLVRDYRLFVNTMKEACTQLQSAGLAADFRVVESEEEYTVTVAIPKNDFCAGRENAG